MARTRLLTGALGATGAAVLVSAGPLDPPAGPVAPTSPSLSDLASLLGSDDDGLIRPIDAPGMSLADDVSALITASGQPFDGDLGQYDDFRLNVGDRRCRLIRRVTTDPLIQQTTPIVGVDGAIESIELRILEMGGPTEIGAPITITGVTLEGRRIEVGNLAIEVYDYSFDAIAIGGAR